MAANFSEKSGIVLCRTSWGTWGQTIDDVQIEVNVPSGTKGKDVKCTIQPREISLSVHGESVFKGQLYGVVIPDDSIWTIEDGNVVRIVLVKSERDAANCWKALLVGEYEANPWEFQNMEKKLTLERFQRENPGFDFSGAEITGQYSGGGPRFND